MAKFDWGIEKETQEEAEARAELEERRERAQLRRRRAGRIVCDVGDLRFSERVDLLLNVDALADETDPDVLAYLAAQHVAFEQSDAWVSWEIDPPVRLIRTVARINRAARLLSMNA